MSTQVRRILFTSDAKFEVKRDGDNKPKALTGYAMVWGVPSTDRGGYRVILSANSAHAENTVLALYSHDRRFVLGNTANQSLRFTSDAHGLKVEIDLPNVTYAKDLLELIDAGYVRGMSFAMTRIHNSKEEKRDGVYHLIVDKFDFDEVTVTPSPAFPETTVEVQKPGIQQPAYTRIRQSHELARLKLAMQSL